MGDPDSDIGEGTISNAVKVAATDGADLPVADIAAFQQELEAGQILAEIMGSGTEVASIAADDLHATLASLSDDAFVPFDVTLQHLTTSVDLFDMAVGHDNDSHHDGS